MTETETIAKKGEYTVFRSGDAIYLRGLGHSVYVFMTKGEWDEFAEIVAYADLKIRGRIQ